MKRDLLTSADMDRLTSSPILIEFIRYLRFKGSCMCDLGVRITTHSGSTNYVMRQQDPHSVALNHDRFLSRKPPVVSNSR